MFIRLIREPSNANTTFGVLLVDGYFQCFTLENSHKIIPAGTYNIELYLSPRFKQLVPLLKNVPNRDMIEIHYGNFYYDFEGCIGVGKHFDTSLYNSKDAFKELMEYIKDQNDIKIKVEDWA